MIHINKNIKFAALTFLVIIGLSCSKTVNDTRNECETIYVNTNETELLLEYLEKNGDPANCKNSCIIDATEVYNNIENNYYVIDLRSQSAYRNGHIKGAINLSIKKLFYHFEEKIEPFKYTKIVLVCYSGQSATYATSLLRLIGYYNVYALEWGMASWNSSLANKWLSKTPNNNIKLSLAETKLNSEMDLPEIKTGNTWRNDILKARVKTTLNLGFKKSSIKLNELIQDTASKFVIAYIQKEQYDKGHILNAVHFPIKTSLKKQALLPKIPNNKEIIIYSKNGYESAYAAAFLNVLGYNAKTLLYGMHELPINFTKSFSKSNVRNYPLEKVVASKKIASHNDEGGC